MVYGGEHATLESCASARERQLKRWSREKKQALVHHSARSGSQRVANGPNQPWYEVVGVVRDPGIDPEKRDSRRARVYHPVVAGGSYPVRMAVHTTGDPLRPALVRRKLIDPCAVTAANPRTRSCLHLKKT